MTIVLKGCPRAPLHINMTIMKKTLIFSVLGLALCMTACNQAQDPAEAAKIARTLKSTEVLADGKIAFRVYAPKAD